jgi:hypothetical protein
VKKIKAIEDDKYEIPKVTATLEESKMYVKKKLNLKANSDITVYRVVGILTQMNTLYHMMSIGLNVKPFDLLVVSLRYVTIADHEAI